MENMTVPKILKNSAACQFVTRRSGGYLPGLRITQSVLPASPGSVRCGSARGLMKESNISVVRIVDSESWGIEVKIGLLNNV
jgi:hypothetical protein